MDKLTSLERRMDKVRPPEPLVDVVYTDGRRERMHWLTAFEECVRDNAGDLVKDVSGVDGVNVDILLAILNCGKDMD
ncbi:MAG: hypothetical protein LUC39_05820 [Clostridiales bacterium]|nr:hypothetical protein [Clostridiales bacterium]